jgi:hypothetical protein
LFVCQIYVDDIIFDSTNKSFYDEFSKIMKDRFEMSMMKVLTFFLGFQIKQAKKRTFISQTKYTCDILQSLAWTKQSQSRRLWALMAILILTWTTYRLIKRYNAPMIGFLVYLHATRADIMLNVCKILSRTQRLSFKGDQQNHEISSSHT